ncbi:alpha/beta fold hydrolase [Amnibacterium sp. CER49]|uniref:bifunctional 3-oxoadipate enol-lactonase/4-carboxymuconolactone decarboxylase PcaDC n=1 Tax=Amnibacterium sp. CER49 TaxID=3039161 RepID=UPI00244B8355|nr:alpha/beta fold hydrolase [Amnibacterium sp. CER49]MDH2443185.1 alpha/beta fold hydrolase [Amnibacterium sp. CER49]
MKPVLRAVVDPTTADAPGVPLLVLGPGLGTTSDTWAAVAARLMGAFRVLRIDLPGHGSSHAATAPFTVADLAGAVLDLVDSLGGGRFTYAGVSLGGAIGLELACGAGADRLDGLVVLCSNARIGEPDGWTARAAQVRTQGTASMVAGSAERWFAPGFLAREPDAGGRALNQLLDVDDESYARCCEALAAFDRSPDVGGIAVPTVVAPGDSDPVVTVEAARALAAAIPGAELVVLPDTGHQAQLERPAEVADLIRGTLAPATDDRYAAGLRVRRAVLGEAYVAASLQRITPETADFQRFITETAWGFVWTRPGLDRRMRSAVTISSLVTAHHWAELELHLAAGLRNGLSRDELAEILLQTAIYAGVPAANTAFGVLRRVLGEKEEER